MRKLGVNLVPKGEDKWQISYSKAEKELRKGIDIDGETCRVKCHRIMKKLREDVWCKHPAAKSTLTSYHLKVSEVSNVNLYILNMFIDPSRIQ